MATSKTSLQRLYLFQLSLTTIPTVPGHTLTMVSGCYLVQTNDGKNILIDSGLPEGYQLMPGRPPSTDEKNVLEHLTDLHLRPEDIHTVICTHFDVDHAGYHDEFTHAEFIVQRHHYELARSGYARFASARAHWDHPSLRYKFVEGDTELLPGLTLLETSGHVPGHQSVLLHLPKTGPVLLAIDAVPLQRLFTPDRQKSPVDEDAEQTLASTHKLLDVAKQEQVELVVFGHDGQQWQTLKRAPEYYA